VASVFHADRWDYAFSIRRQGVEPQNFRLTLIFKGDALTQITGDDLPCESEFVSRLVKSSVVRKLPALEASDEALQKYPVRKPAEADDRPVPPLPASYPPLEPVAR
jgi:outer membrane protein assembly factor BamE